MNVLVVGKGGREHTLAWALRRSPLVEKLYAAPGNPGIDALGECVPIAPEDASGIAGFARDNGVDLVVVGPDGALEAGVVDAVERAGIRAFGPTRAAAEIEWSKVFSKQLMREEGIPTAEFAVFTDVDAARGYVNELGAPIVVKADGLAAGKGALVCRTVEEAGKALDVVMTEKKFGDAGRKVVVEAFMEGEEASVFALTDGERVLPLVPSQDHKPIYDGDRGPNTGGMGAYAPAPVVDEGALRDILERIVEPAVLGMRNRGRPFRGVLYCGIMMTRQGPMVVEFNSRFGDPEAQVILPLLEDDFAELAVGISEGGMPSGPLTWKRKAATCVVVASGGYPGDYEKGMEISGLDEVDGMDDVFAFHADTARRDGTIVTNGGRILGVTALADDLRGSIDRAYEAVDRVRFAHRYFRSDIGEKGLRRMA